MLWRLLADVVLVLHLAFIAFVVLGGLFVRWRRWFVFVHLPCALYGVAIEVFGWICPLTPLENRLRALGGEQGYRGGFVEHYLVPLIYPDALTPAVQGGLAFAVALTNALVYAWAILPAARTARR
jgi:hypothetical protein